MPGQVGEAQSGGRWQDPLTVKANEVRETLLRILAAEQTRRRKSPPPPPPMSKQRRVELGGSSSAHHAVAGAGPPRARPSCNDDVSGATIPDRNVVDSAAGSLMLAKVAFEELETKVKQLILELEAVRDDRDCVRFQLRLAREAQLAEAPRHAQELQRASASHEAELQAVQERYHKALKQRTTSLLLLAEEAKQVALEVEVTGEPAPQAPAQDS